MILYFQRHHSKKRKTLFELTNLFVAIVIAILTITPLTWRNTKSEYFLLLCILDAQWLCKWNGKEIIAYLPLLMSNRQGNLSVSQSTVWYVYPSPQSTIAPGSVSAWAVAPGSPRTSYLGCHVVRNTASWLTTNLYWSTRIAANLRMGSMLWRTYEMKAT